MKLLYTPRSPYARKVCVVALEKAIALDCVSEDLVNKSSRLLQANPLGKIPTLILDDGRTIADSPVICEYLDSLKENPALIPKEPCLRSSILTFAAIADGLMDVTVGAFMERRRHPDDFNAAFISAQQETTYRCLTYFDAQLEQWQGLNLAGIGIASAIGYLRFRLPHWWPASHCQRLARWYEEFSQRKSMQETAPRE